jgi:hypothetical protein
MRFALTTSLLGAGLIALTGCGQAPDAPTGTSGAAPAKTPAAETAGNAGAGGEAAAAAEQQTETVTLAVNGMT